MRSKLSPISLHRASFAVWLVVIACGQSFAQSAAARPDRGIMPIGSYYVSDIETIDNTNGNVHLSIPLASLPPMAGGTLAAVIRATYDSKLWDARTEERQQFVMEPIYAARVLQLSENGGWKIGGMYSIESHPVTNDYDYMANPDDPEYYSITQYPWAKLTLTTPDGAVHELRPVDYAPYQGGHEYLIGYFKDNPNNNGGVAMRYYSFDGSFLWAKLYPYTSPTSWELYLPDGTKVVQLSSGIQRITDANNNSVKIYTDVENGLTTTHYQDEQTGREIKIAYNPSGNNNQGAAQVLYQTVGGAWAAVDINFGITTVSGKIYDIQGPYCQFQEPLVPTDLQVIREIVLPQTESGVQRQKFTFTYNSDTSDSRAVYWQPYGCGNPQLLTNSPSHGWGSLNQVTTPRGAVGNYTYTLDGVDDIDADMGAGETVSAKTIVHDGTSHTWSYTIGSNGGSVTAPDGSIITNVKYFHSPAYGFVLGGSNGLAGLVYRTNQANKILVERHWVRMKFDGAYDNAPGALLVFNPVVDAEYTSLLENGTAVKMSAKTFQYDYNGNLLSQTDYDWFDPSLVSRDGNGIPTGVPVSATVLRVINNTYYNVATASSSGNVYAKRSVSTATPLILNALQQSVVGPLTTQLSYDGQAYGIAPTVGNLTSKSVWDNVGNQWITTSSTYGLYGNLATSTDARGKVTQFFYDDATHALPNRVVVDPQNGTGTQTTTTAYDFSTGLVTSVTDANGNLSEINYTNQLLGSVDPFGRPGVTIGPLVNIGGVNQRQRVTTTYLDAARQVIVATDLYAENDKLLKTRTTTDMLGRVTLTEQTEDGTNYTITARKAYDIANRMTFSSSPMRPGAAVTDSWTRVTNDVLGRVIEIATFAGANQPTTALANQIAGWTGSVTTAYDANFTTVTDQVGKQRRSVTDGLGRLIRVDEPDSSGSLGTTASPNQPTNYAYDVLGNLRTVIQGAQTRFFMYDSLSRLVRARNPEQGTLAALNLTDPITGNSQWSVGYVYDDNGNLTSKTDARSITPNYVYDSLNRVTSRSYQNDPNSTPAVTYIYDTLSQNGKGRLTSVSSNVSSYSYSGYDAMGRVSGGTQTIGSQNYTLTYTYYLAGHVKTMQYPSGRTVTYAYDNAGRSISVIGNLGDGGAQRNYATEILYDAGGRMTKERFGTTTPIYNKLFYNSRGQLAEIRESTSYTGPTDTTWDRGAIINHYSNQGGCWGAWCNATDNNGNLMRQEVYIPTAGNYAQFYEYDSLNRLKSARENWNGGATNWQQAYLYDRFGNRRIDTNPSQTFGGVNNLNFELETATNRLYGPGDLALPEASRSMRYDASGNLWKDTYSGAAVGQQAIERLYDAENRMTKESQANNYVAAVYSYDGDGHRVKRIVGSVETWQVYGVGGELLAEYSANAAATNPQKEYGYRNGRLLITATVTSGWGAPPVLNDNPLQVGITTVQARHITELREAINALRSHLSMSAYSWQYSATTNDYINANPILEMRTALDQALGAPAGGYAAGLAQGQPVKAIHIQELRDRVLAAWQSGGGIDIRWLVSDQLGTPRMLFDQTGSLANVSRHDYLPFGEELFAGTGGRTTSQGYANSDGIRQKFTQKERDNETGLDYFGARYFASIQGRFTSPDPMLSSGRPIHPQSWNRYSYVINQPLSLVDPNGLDWGYADWTDDKGVNHRDYHYFTGDIGNWNGHSYTAVNFGGDATRTLDLSDGRTVAISNDAGAFNGSYMRDVTIHAQTKTLPVLDPSWVDYVPVAGNARAFLFHYGTHNFEAALLDFGLASVELGTANVGASAVAAKSFATGTGEAIFYSGGKAAFQAATEAAVSEGGTTISMTFGGRVLQKATAPLPERASTWVWNWGSKHFAEGASGNVRVFLREPIRSNSTWNTVEYPILRVNPFVRTVPR